MTSKQIKKWRTKLGWTQEKASAYFSVSVAAWRNWEQERRKVPNWLPAAIKRSHWSKQ